MILITLQTQMVTVGQEFVRYLPNVTHDQGKTMVLFLSKTSPFYYFPSPLLISSFAFQLPLLFVSLFYYFYSSFWGLLGFLSSGVSLCN